MAKGEADKVGSRRHGRNWGQDHSHFSTVPIPSDSFWSQLFSPSISNASFLKAFPLYEGGQRQTGQGHPGNSQAGQNDSYHQAVGQLLAAGHLDTGQRPKAG